VICGPSRQLQGSHRRHRHSRGASSIGASEPARRTNTTYCWDRAGSDGSRSGSSGIVGGSGAVPGSCLGMVPGSAGGSSGAGRSGAVPGSCVDMVLLSDRLARWLPVRGTRKPFAIRRARLRAARSQAGRRPPVARRQTREQQRQSSRGPRSECASPGSVLP